MEAPKCQMCGARHWSSQPHQQMTADLIRAKFSKPAPAAPPKPAAAAPVAVKSKGGRPRIHPDRKAYKAQKEKERRAKLKATAP